VNFSRPRRILPARIGGFEVGECLLELGEHVAIVRSFPEEEHGLNGGDRPVGGEIPAFGIAS
jgi:hypothetical protein